MNLVYLQQLADQSGGILYLMSVLLTITLTVSVERTWALRNITRYGNRLINGLATVRIQDRAQLAQLCTEALPLHQTLLEAVLTLEPEQVLAERLEELIFRHIPLLDRRLWILDTSVTLAPLLGLLGTIIGMFHTFQVLATPGAAPHIVTGGVAEALVATAAGLLIAVLGLIFFNGLNERVRLAVHQLETLKLMLVNRFAVGKIPPTPLFQRGAIE